MKISEMVNILQKELADRGDLEVAVLGLCDAKSTQWEIVPKVAYEDQPKNIATDLYTE